MKNKNGFFNKRYTTYFLFNISDSADAPSKRENRQTGKKWGKSVFKKLLQTFN